MARSFIGKSDSYKVTHYAQIPEGTTRTYSYLESRSDREQIVFFGLQPILIKHFVGKQVTQHGIDAWKQRIDRHMGPGLFNLDGWEYILNEHDGRLPLLIKAVPEGSVYPSSNILISVENTDPHCAWLTNYAETILSHVWYPCTVASRSKKFYELLKTFLNKSADSDAGIQFMLHNFGYRGVTCDEQSEIGDAAHCLYFRGSDTMSGLEFTEDYYNAKSPSSFSIPASEHATMIIWGEDHEKEAMENMLDKFPTGIIACVSDQYNIFRAVQDIWGGSLRDKILSRKGTLVIRPDSGDPLYVIPTLLKLLWESFGGTTNGKGYKVLDSHVRLIQGDGVNFFSLGALLEKIVESGFSVENLAFGSGGGLMQMVDRDTFKFAFKQSWAEVNGKPRSFSKHPITDPGKTSKSGRLSLIHDNDSVITVSGDVAGDILRPVFQNGHLQNFQNWEEVCARIML